MFVEIQKQLAKLIAQGIYDSATKHGPKALQALQQTDLKSGGKGLPPPILVEFEKSFTAALNARPFQRDGYTKWPAKTGEEQFDFLLRDPMADRVARSDWASAAKGTADGTRQVAAIGGDAEYRKVMAAIIGSVFDRTISACVGRFVPSLGGTYGFCVLTPVRTVQAAPERTTQFNEVQLFYWVYGKEEDTPTRYKLAKSLMFTGLIFKRPVSPSAGPYLT